MMDLVKTIEDHDEVRNVLVRLLTGKKARIIILLPTHSLRKVLHRSHNKSAKTIHYRILGRIRVVGFRLRQRCAAHQEKDHERGQEQGL